jgi:hypothetical protein
MRKHGAFCCVRYKQMTVIPSIFNAYRKDHVIIPVQASLNFPCFKINPLCDFSHYLDAFSPYFSHVMVRPL